MIMTLRVMINRKLPGPFMARAVAEPALQRTEGSVSGVQLTEVTFSRTATHFLDISDRRAYGYTVAGILQESPCP